MAQKNFTIARKHGTARFRVHGHFFVILCALWVTGPVCCAAYSQTSVDSDGTTHGGPRFGGMTAEQLAGYGVLDSSYIEELQRLSDIGRTQAVQALISGAEVIAEGNAETEAEETVKHMTRFVADMEGEPFLRVDDTPDQARYRKALFIAFCRTLANEHKEQARATEGVYS